jgi:hypothetical protein
MSKFRLHFTVDSNWFDVHESEIKAMKFEDVDELIEYLQERAIDHIDLLDVDIEPDDVDQIVEYFGIGETEKNAED